MEFPLYFAYFRLIEKGKTKLKCQLKLSLKFQEPNLHLSSLQNDETIMIKTIMTLNSSIYCIYLLVYLKNNRQDCR